MKKIIMILAMIGFFFLLFPSFSSAGACPNCPTTMNPFTQKLDYYGYDNRSLATCAVGYANSWNGTFFNCVNVSGGGGGSGDVTDVFAANGLYVINSAGPQPNVTLNKTQISSCTSPTSSKIIWNATNNIFDCAVDQNTNNDGTGGWYNDSTNSSTPLSVNISGGLNIAKNTTSLNFFGFLNWSYLLNIPSYVKDWTADLTALNTSVSVGVGLLQTNLTAVDTRQLNNNATQAALITGVTNNESNDNTTQAALINAGFTNDSTISTRESADNTTQAALINSGFTNDSTIFTRELSDNTTQSNQINNINTQIAADNTTQALQIAAINTTELADNITQAALINSGFTNDSTISTRESADNTTQAALINAGFTNDSTIFTRESSDNASQASLINSAFSNDSTIFTREASDNSTQSSQIAAINTTELADNTTQAALINLRVIAGSCAAGTVVQNTTTGGVQCITAGTGTVTSITANAPALGGGLITSSGNVSLNLTFLDARYGQSYFYITQIANNTGTINGSNSNANTVDGLYINVTETASGLNVTFNFTVNTSFNGVDFRQKYTADVASQMVLTMYNTLTANYDVIETLGAENNYINSRIPVFNSTPYINTTTNITQLRIYTISTVLSTDILSIDVLTLNSQGIGSDQTDSIVGGGTPGYLSLWSDVSSLADSVINQTVGNIFVRNNLTAINFYGNINWSYLQNIPSYVKDYSTDLTALNTSTQVGIGLLQTNITNVDTSWKNSNSTQALQIASVNTTELADNTTQAALINSGFTNDSTISTRESNDNTTQAALINSGFTNDSTIFTRQSSDNTTLAAYIAAVNTSTNLYNQLKSRIDNNSLNTTNAGADAQMLIKNGTQFTWITPGGATYFAGLGLNLTGTTFNINLTYFLTQFYSTAQVDTTVANLEANISNQNSTLTTAISSLNNTMLNSNSTQAILINNKGNLSSSLGSSGYIQQYQSSAILNNSNIFQNNSNIGINTTAPTFMLQVSGNANITNLTLSSLTAASCDVKADAQGALICGTDANSGATIPLSNVSFKEAYYPNLIFGTAGGLTPSALDTNARCTGFEIPGNTQAVFNNITVWVRTANTTVDYKFGIYNCTSPAKFLCTNGTLLINSSWVNMATTGLLGVANGTTNWVLGSGYYAACMATNNTNAMNNAFQGFVNTGGQNGVYTSGVINGTFPTTVTFTPSAQNMPAIWLTNMYGVAK